MIIEIAKLSPDENHFQGSESGKILELGQEEDVQSVDSVDYDLRVSLVSDRLLVHGTVSGTVEVRCVRCAEFYRMALRDSSFRRDHEVDESTESVDLTGDIRESIILAFPVRPICGPDCRGLCAQCGTNLNKGTCDCRPPADSSAWNALNDLKLD